MPRKGPIKQKGSTDTPRSICALIIGIRVLYSERWEDISAKIGVPKSTCSEDLITLLEYTEKKNNRAASGKATVKIRPFSLQSILIKDVCHAYPKETWEKAVRGHTPYDLSRPTIAKINVLYPHPRGALTRRFEQFKPILTGGTREWCSEYCKWALELIERYWAIFIFTDETYISVGGRPHKRQRVAQFKEEEPETRSPYEQPIYFSITQWGQYARTLR